MINMLQNRAAIVIMSDHDNSEDLLNVLVE